MRDCDEKHGYLCMNTRAYGAQPPPTAAPDIGGRCLAGWAQQLGGFCYQINVTSGVVFTDAFAQCRALGAGTELASIGSEPEQEFVWAEAKRQYEEAGRPPTLNQIWLGFAVRDGRLTALDASPITFTNWYPNEPNPDAEPGRIYCVRMNIVSGRWSSVPCGDTVEYGMACKRPKRKSRHVNELLNRFGCSACAPPTITRVLPSPLLCSSARSAHHDAEQHEHKQRDDHLVATHEHYDSKHEQSVAADARTYVLLCVLLLFSAQ